jgi:hypothetical protein
VRSAAYGGLGNTINRLLRMEGRAAFHPVTSARATSAGTTITLVSRSFTVNPHLDACKTTITRPPRLCKGDYFFVEDIELSGSK